MIALPNGPFTQAMNLRIQLRVKTPPLCDRPRIRLTELTFELAPQSVTSRAQPIGQKLQQLLAWNCLPSGANPMYRSCTSSQLDELDGLSDTGWAPAHMYA